MKNIIKRLEAISTMIVSDNKTTQELLNVIADLKSQNIGWSSVKPDFPCLFVARIKSKWGTTTEIFTIDKTEGYLRLISNDGMEDEALEDLQADEYFMIERY